MSATLAAKLRLTAAALGCGTRKELCARFRAVNPATAFDLDRSHKWLQGVASPRTHSVYDDWAKLIGTAQSGGWIAGCSVEAFAAELVARFSADPAEIAARADAFGRRGGRLAHAPDGPRAQAPRDHRAGAFVAYSWAMSQWHAGQLIRGVLRLEAAPGGRYRARFEEACPDGPFRLEGGVHIDGRLMFCEFAPDPSYGDVRFYFTLMGPGRPLDALIGDVIGVTMNGTEPRLASTPMVLLRVDEAGAAAALAVDCYLPPDPAALEADFAAFRIGGGRGRAVAEAVLDYVDRPRRGAAHSTAEALGAIAARLREPCPPAPPPDGAIMLLPPLRSA